MTTVVLVLMNTYFLTASRDMIFTSKQAFVQDKASIIATNLEESFDVLTIEAVARVMPHLNIAGVTHITITDAGGAALYPEADEFSSSDGWYSEENLKKALSGYDVLYSRFDDGAFYSSAFMPVMKHGVIIGAVCVRELDREQGKLLLDMQNTLKNISIIVIVFTFAMVAFIIWSVLRRITSIFKAIKSVREGQYSYRISMTGNDELALLGDEFNSLTDRLRETEEIRRSFVANASHELKTPLASIRLLSDSILQNEGMDQSTVHEFISDIGAEAERLTRTTEKLMTLTRLDGIVPEQYTGIDVGAVVVSTLRMLRPLAQSREIEISSEIERHCYVLATEDTLHQIVFNLVENAIKYNKHGGSVTVILKQDGGNVVLTVDDTGIGVPDDDLPYIFDRFYRVDKARSREAGGSGLGLSIVRDAVRELGGTVTAARLISGGMRFQVRFGTLK